MEIVSVGWSTELALLQARGSVAEHHRTHVVVSTPDRPADRTANFVLLRRAPRGADVAIALQRFTTAFGPAAPVSLAVDDPEGARSDLEPLAAQGLTTQAPLVLVATEVVRPAAGDVEVRTVGDAEAGVDVRFQATVGGRPAGTAGVSAAGPGW
ncbi:hypothetical protein [Nocardioides plantarum]|uniref:Uncharacterized protein n=1 Tax=Nocardioides plantarum TaxID=29299 RepID=A0ABV5KET3_9ACTN|nr:hypothetical protein [Nocardioides plantarum]